LVTVVSVLFYLCLLITLWYLHTFFLKPVTILVIVIYNNTFTPFVFSLYPSCCTFITPFRTTLPTCGFTWCMTCWNVYEGNIYYTKFSFFYIAQLVIFTSFVRYDLNLNIECLRFYDIAYFTVFDSFSHPFLLCQYLFTFCILLNKKLHPFDQILGKVVLENTKYRSNLYRYLALL
jgi:hypothetical protein